MYPSTLHSRIYFVPARLLSRTLGHVIQTSERSERAVREESRMSWTRASLYFSRRLHHRDDYRLIFWLWENDYTAETIRDKPGWTYVKKNGTTTAQVVRFHDHPPPPPPPPPAQLPGPLSMVRGLGGKSGETLKGFTGLRTLDSARIGSRSTGETKCTLKKEKEGKRECATYIRSILRVKLNFRYVLRNVWTNVNPAAIRWYYSKDERFVRYT